MHYQYQKQTIRKERHWKALCENEAEIPILSGPCWDVSTSCLLPSLCIPRTPGQRLCISETPTTCSPPAAAVSCRQWHLGEHCSTHTPLGGKLVGGDWQVGQGWCLQHILHVTHTLEQQPNSFCCWISTVSCSIPWEVFFFSFFSFLYPPCCFS